MRLHWIAPVATGLVFLGVLVASVGAEQSALPSGNLVKNPGAEASPGVASTAAVQGFAPAGWETARIPESTSDDDAFVAARYGTHGYFPPKEVSAKIGGGKNFFYGGYPPKTSTATQTIDVTGAGAEIDAGDVKACLSGYIGGTRNWAQYTMRIELQLLAEDESALGRLSIGPVTPAQRNNEITLVRRAAEKPVPKGTRSLRVVMIANSPGTGPIYAYADNVSAALTKGSCDPVLTVKCAGKALVATVAPSTVAPIRRVALAVTGGKTKRATDSRAPYSSRFTMDGLAGKLTITATVSQKDGATITLTSKSRRC
jgi:hypothetical protein